MNEKKYDVLKLENQLCFPLYASSREVIKLYKPFLDRIDLTYTQYIAMMVLWERRSVNVKEMGECLYLDSGTLTPLLKKMEAKGLITRMRSEKDERNLIVGITPKGEALREEALAIPAGIVKCNPLSPQESMQLHALLYKLLNQISEKQK